MKLNNKLPLNVLLPSMFALSLTSANAGVRGLENVKSATLKDNGLFFVECDDGSTEDDVSLEDLKTDNVCPNKKEEPKPDKVVLSDLTLNGSGCKIDTSSVEYDPMTRLFTLNTPELAVGGESDKDRLFCNLATKFETDGTWQYALLLKKSEQIGYVEEDTTASVKITSGTVGDNKGEIVSKVLGKDHQGDTFELKGDEDKLVYTECGKVFPLNTKITLRIKGSSKGKSYLSLTEKSPLEFKVKWRKCD